MHWETKLAALNALSECKLIMRQPGDWYVSQDSHIKEHGGCTMVGAYGNGTNPQEAVEDHWATLTDLKPMQYLIAKEYWDGETRKRTAARWNGFMWEHVEEEKRVA